ncbi:MAG: site-2 protease family protein [Pirellulales bacterium]
MIFSEPPRTQADLNFSLLGIPVRIHPFFWIVSALLGARSDTPPVEVLMWVAVVLVSILVHELGHAVIVRRYGARPWITLHGFGGVTMYDPSEFSQRRGWEGLRQIVISLAGPCAGFLLAAVVAGAMIATGHRLDFLGWRLVPGEALANERTWILVQFLLYVNVFWGILNLFPLYPLDGGQIFREVLLLANPRRGIEQSLWLSVFTGAGLAVLAATRLGSLYMGLFFGYLAYSSYATLQAYRSHFENR